MIAVLAFTFRFALAIVLAVAAVAKARSFGAFVRTVDAVVPWQRTARAAAVAVIAVEMTLAVLLAAGVWVNAVSLVTLALFLGFAAVSLWADRHELHVRCNCFGRSERELGKDSLVTSLLLAGATVAYWALLRRTDDSLTLGEVPLAVVLGAVTVLAARWLLTAVAGKLRITGTRLDPPAAVLSAEVPSGYEQFGYQPSSILVPEPGCWEITGSVGEQTLRVVADVLAHELHPMRAA